MFLQWVLVKMLANHNQKDDTPFTRMMFLGHLSQKKWLLFFRDVPHLKKDTRFLKRVDDALGDCIRGEASYMDEDRDGVLVSNENTDLNSENPIYDNPLLVTPKGRIFISFWVLGLGREFLNTYGIVVSFVMGFGLGAIPYILNKVMVLVFEGG